MIDTMDPKVILSLLPFFQSDLGKLDYILITLFVNNKQKKICNEKKRWAEQWMRSVWCIWKTVILFMHCWIKLGDSLKRVITCGLCVNGFQKQLEILMKASCATRIDWIISRIENKMLVKKKLYQLWKSLNWNLGYGSLSFSWFFSLPCHFGPLSEEWSCGFRWMFSLAQNSFIQVDRDLGRSVVQPPAQSRI